MDARIGTRRWFGDDGHDGGGCSSTSNTAGLNTIQAPSQLRPVQGSTVAQGTLPAIGAPGTPAPGLSGQPVLGGVAAQPTTGFNTLPPVQGSTMQTATVNGALAAADPAGRGQFGPRRGVTVIAGTNQCRLNLPADAQGRRQLLPGFGAGLRLADADGGGRMAAGRPAIAAL